MDDTVSYSYTQNRLDSLANTLGGLEVAILLPGSYIHLQLNSITLKWEQKVVHHPLKNTQCQSIIVNTPFMIQLTKYLLFNYGKKKKEHFTNKIILFTKENY